jgi:hypothetical protein
VIAKLKTIAAFAVMLCAVFGCASPSSILTSSNNYELTVNFYGYDWQTNQQIKIDVRVGVPFVVKTQDEAGNHYQVSGTLRQGTQGTFLLERGTIDRYHTAWDRETTGQRVYLGKLDEGYGWGAIDGILLPEAGTVLTKK